MTETYRIEPLTGPFEASLRPPGSKSLTNRVLLLAALADGTSELNGVLDADDPARMREALVELGIKIDERAPGSPGSPNDLKVQGGLLTGSERAGHVSEKSHQSFELSQGKTSGGAGGGGVHLGNAGTAYRFLTAACCLGKGTFELDGIARMRKRPIAQLVDPLRQLGAKIEYLGQDGYPPLRITGGTIGGGELTMQPTLSSQYISALLQIAPYLDGGLTLCFEGPVTSVPYVAMTLNLMAMFGIEAEVDPSFTRIHVPQGRYKAATYNVEPDASSASYFLAAAAIVPQSKCTIKGLGFRSLQGDSSFAEVLGQMGAGVVCEPDSITVIGPPADQPLEGIDLDMNHIPDMALTLATVALFAKGTTTMRNIGNLRVKETDRMAALETELTRLGATVKIEGDDLSITPPTDPDWTIPAGTVIQTYDDHRMAMGFALVGLVKSGLIIYDPACVNKTFPDFFEYLQQLGT